MKLPKPKQCRENTNKTYVIYKMKVGTYNQLFQISASFAQSDLSGLFF